MFVLLLSRSRLITHGDVAPASSQFCSGVAAARRRVVRRVLLPAAQPNHQNTRICWGQPCLAIIFFSFSQFFACARCCHEFHGSHRECRTLLVNAFLSLPRMWLSRSTSKIDAFGDDETARCSRKSAVLGCAGLRLALPPRKAFLNIDLETSMCAAQTRSAKHFVNYATDTSWHSPQTPTAPQRQTTRGKTCIFCHRSLNQNFGLP